jgi:hypothetical protein
MFSSQAMFYIFISKAAPCTPKCTCAPTRNFPYSLGPNGVLPLATAILEGTFENDDFAVNAFTLSKIMEQLESTNCPTDKSELMTRPGITCTFLAASGSWGQSKSQVCED